MADYSLCDFTLKQLKDIAKDFKIPTTKMKKCDLIILLDRAGYGEDYIYVPPRKTKFQKKTKQMDQFRYFVPHPDPKRNWLGSDERPVDDAEEKLKYNLCIDRRNKLYSLSKSQLHQKIKKRNPNFIIPEHLTQQQIIDEIMYLDECYDLVPNNFSSKLEFISEKIYMKPINERPAQFRYFVPHPDPKRNWLGSDERPEPRTQSSKTQSSKTQSKTKNAFLANKDEERRLERLSIRDLLEILYSRQYYPMELINKLKTREQMVKAIMMRESDVLKMISKL